MIALIHSGIVAEIVMIDQNEKKAEGEAQDAFHTTSFTYVPNILVRQGGYEDCQDAQIIVMTAGPSIKPGEQLNRRVLAQTNVNVTRAVMKEIVKYTKEAIIIFVSNPVDVLTYVAQNEFQYPKSKIIGSGTLLDTARLRRIIGEYYLVDTKNVHGYILGEHGQTAMATWSNCNIAGMSLEAWSQMTQKALLNQEEVLQEVKEAGLKILLKKGYTNYGIAETVARIVKAIILNELSILPVSTTLQGEYGICDVALSIPCIIGQNGIEKTLTIPLTQEEQKQLVASGDSLKQLIATVE